jgi:hypothetical protein
MNEIGGATLKSADQACEAVAAAVKNGAQSKGGAIAYEIEIA